MENFEDLQKEYSEAKLRHDWRAMAEIARRAQPGLEEPQTKVKVKKDLAKYRT